MSSYYCPECGSSNLIDYLGDPIYFECLDCGAVHHSDECQVRQRKSQKMNEKPHFDDGSGNSPRERKPEYRRDFEDDYPEIEDFDA